MASLYLTSDETVRCREAFEAHAEDYVIDIFQLRLICGDLGQYPSDEQLKVCLHLCKGRVDLSLFCRFATYLKYLYMQQDIQHEEDDDTNSAFAALSEAANTVDENTVPTSRLLQTCESFSLQTEALDDALGSLDGPVRNGTLTLPEFRTMWAHFAGSASTEAHSQKPRQSVLEPGSPFSVSSPLNASLKNGIGLKNTSLEMAIGAFIRPGESLVEEIPAQSSPKRRTSRRGSLGRRGFPALFSGRDESTLEESTLSKEGRRRSMLMDSKVDNILLSSTGPNAKFSHASAETRKAKTHVIDTSASSSGTVTKKNESVTKVDNNILNAGVYQPIHLPPIKPKKVSRNLLQSTVLEKRLEAMRNSRIKFQRSSHHTKGMLVHDDLLTRKEC